MNEFRIALHLAIFVQIFSEKLSVGRELAIQRSDHKRFALFHKVQEGKKICVMVLSIVNNFFNRHTEGFHLRCQFFERLQKHSWKSVCQ